METVLSFLSSKGVECTTIRYDLETSRYYFNYNGWKCTCSIHDTMSYYRIGFSARKGTEQIVFSDSSCYANLEMLIGELKRFFN